MRRSRRRLFALLVLLAAPAFSLCERPSAAGADGPSIEGFAEPFKSVRVASPESGIVAQVAVEEGDVVRQGQLLLALDTQLLETMLDIQDVRRLGQGQLEAAKAELKMCRTKLDKVRELQGQGFANEQEVDRIRTDMEVAAARLTVAEEQEAVDALEYAKMKTMIERRRIASPIDGVVVSLDKEPGEAIVANDPVVATVAELDRLRVRFSVSPSTATTFHEGDAVSIRCPASGATVDATVDFLSPIVDARSGTMELTVVFENKDGRIRSGSLCVLEIPPPVDASPDLP